MAYISLIPPMTAADANVATASSQWQSSALEGSAWAAFDGSQAPQSYWWATVNANVTPQWLQYKFTTAKVVTKYSFVSYVNNGYHPTQWKFQGSNNGSDWTDLHHVPNTTPNNLSLLEYEISNTTAYTHYRFYVMNGNNVNGVAIMSLNMFGGPFEYGPNIAPTGMTSNAGPGGVAFGTFESVPYKLFDSDDTTTYAYAQGVFPHIFGIQLPQARTVAKFRFRTYTDINYTPKDFTFQGSNDGTNYDVLLTVTNAPNNFNTWEEYEFLNSTSYTYYRIVQTSGYGAQEMALFSLEMFELAGGGPTLQEIAKIKTAGFFAAE